MNHRAPLTEVNTGDQVILRRRLGTQPYSLVTVERTTQTQIILSSDRRFRRKDGLRLGGYHPTWDRDIIFGASEKNRQELASITMDQEIQAQRRLTIHKLKAAQWGYLSTDQLERIAAILDE